MALAAAAGRSAIGGGSMVHRLDLDLGLHRLAAAADGGGSGDYAWAEAYLGNEWHLVPSSHLATIYRPKNAGEGLLCPFGGELGPHLTIWI